MNKEFLHKIISIWVAILVMLPMSVQFAHALEDHSHDICKENSLQHFHKHEIECEFDHYFFKTNATSFSEKVQDDITILLESSPIYFLNTFYKFSFLKPNSRGPPQNII